MSLETAIGGPPPSGARTLAIGRWRRSPARAVPSLLALAIVAAAPVAARSQGQPASPVPPAPARLELLAAELLAPLEGERRNAPASSLAYAPSPDAAPARHPFAGRLVLGTAGVWRHRLLDDTFGLGAPPEAMRLPPVALTFVRDESRLLPADPGLIHTGHSRWNLVVGTGRVWSEPRDGGWSRAAFPFALVERNQNCTHNGVATFLYDDAAVSSLAYQVTQETCHYFRADLWGRVDADYVPGPVPRESLDDGVLVEHRSRLLTRSVDDLASDPEGRALVEILRGDPEHLTTFGVILDGLHYTSTPLTRSGPATFPAEWLVPSYSLAKSVFAAVAVMLLAESDGDHVPDLRLVDLIPDLEALTEPIGTRDAWSRVTLEHALDMATGLYRSPSPGADEGDDPTGEQFFRRESLAEKLAAAVSYPRRSPPGERWVYHTTDTFLLTHALSRYLGARAGEGAGADPFAFVSRSVYAPLGLSANARRSVVRTGNAPDGLPLGGYGLFLTTDDIAKLALFLGRDRGRISDRQVLHPELLDQALQRAPGVRGLAAIHRDEPRRYDNGFWAMRLDEPEPPGRAGGGSDPAEADRETWVALLLGYGGIVVALVGDDAFYQVRDDYVFSYPEAAAALVRWRDSRPPSAARPGDSPPVRRGG